MVQVEDDAYAICDASWAISKFNSDFQPFSPDNIQIGDPDRGEGDVSWATTRSCTRKGNLMCLLFVLILRTLDMRQSFMTMVSSMLFESLSKSQNKAGERLNLPITPSLRNCL